MPEDNFQLNTPALPGTVMPFSAEAEQAVLGAVLLEPDCLSTVAEMLPRADYFYQVNNRTIYSAMLDMFTAGQPVDLVTLLEHLRSHGVVSEVDAQERVLVRPMIVHLANPQNLQALLQHLRKLTQPKQQEEAHADDE